MLKPPQMGDPRTFEIIGAAMEVHREFGPGFLEGVYQDALEIEFQLRGIPYEREKAIVIKYKGQPLNHRYRADFVCYDEILAETKALKQLVSIRRSSNTSLSSCNWSKTRLADKFWRTQFGASAFRQRQKQNKTDIIRRLPGAGLFNELKNQR